MKKKYNKINNKAGVSAIIGVILMVAITVAIAGTVYVYVSGMMNDMDYEQNYVFEGTVDYIYENNNDDGTVLIISHQSFVVDNDISFFDGINNGDNIRIFFYGDTVDHWELI